MGAAERRESFMLWGYQAKEQNAFVKKAASLKPIIDIP
jgi:hypothetical protein